MESFEVSDPGLCASIRRHMPVMSFSSSGSSLGITHAYSDLHSMLLSVSCHRRSRIRRTPRSRWQDPGMRAFLVNHEEDRENRDVPTAEMQPCSVHCDQTSLCKSFFVISGPRLLIIASSTRRTKLSLSSSLSFAATVIVKKDRMRAVGSRSTTTCLRTLSQFSNDCETSRPSI